MSRDEFDTPEMNFSSWEAELASLAPRQDRLDRDRIMFAAGQIAAGQAAAARHAKPWQLWACSGVSSVVSIAATALVMLALSGSGQSSSGVAEGLDQPASPETAQALDREPTVPALADASGSAESPVAVRPADSWPGVQVSWGRTRAERLREVQRELASPATWPVATAERPSAPWSDSGGSPPYYLRWEQVQQELLGLPDSGTSKAES